MPETPEPSDQLPEEAPEEQVAEDEQDPGQGATGSSSGDRERAEVPEPREQATGNPENAG